MLEVLYGPRRRDLGANRTGGVEMRGTLRRATTSGYGRTAIVALASTALLAGTWGSASGATAPPAAPFHNGTAKATAVVARVAPGVGALQLGISGGVAVSEVKNTVAQSQAESLDLGLIGSTLTAQNCHGGNGVLTQSELPHPVTVDSRNGPASGSADQVPLAGTTLGGGHKEAHASPTPPTSDATATLVGSSIPGLLTLGGGMSVASTRVIKGEAREAHAKVSVNLDIAGLVKLSGLSWDAFHRTGKDPKATASFDIGTGSLLGVPIPLESLVQTEAAINSALAYTGLTITFPRVERFTTPADLIRITPLRIVLQDSPVGKATLGPILNLTRAQRAQLFTQLSAAICDAAAGLLLGDIGIDIASGTGFLVVEIGGAEATTGDLVLDSPFGTIGPAPAGTLPLVLPPTIVPGGNLPTLTAPSSPLGPTAQRTSAIGPLADHCQSAHPASTPPARRAPCSRSGSWGWPPRWGSAASTGATSADGGWARPRRAGDPPRERAGVHAGRSTAPALLRAAAGRRGRVHRDGHVGVHPAPPARGLRRGGHRPQRRRDRGHRGGGHRRRHDRRRREHGRRARPRGAREAAAPREEARPAAGAAAA